MDLHGYVERIESSVEDPPGLEQLRAEIAADESLEPADREFLSERVGTYLADGERELGELDVDGPDTGEDV